MTENECHQHQHHAAEERHGDDDGGNDNNININPFSDWSKLVHLHVYSFDGKRVGRLTKITADYMVIKVGLVTLNRYFVPKSHAESIDRKRRIRLSITKAELKSRYSYARMKNLLTAIESIPESQVKHRPLHDRLQALRHSITRNRLAACVAFTSGMLFLLSGYKANVEIYKIIIQQLASIDGLRAFLSYIIIPVGVLALVSQLGGIAVLMGAALFAANRVNLGKFLVMIGTGQGLFTIVVRLVLEVWSGHTWAFNNYILWLTSSASGLGIIFAILSQSISKGEGESIPYKVLMFVFHGIKRFIDRIAYLFTW